MNPIAALLHPLNHLQLALDKRDVPGVIRAAGQLAEPMARLYSTPAPSGDAAASPVDSGRGDRLLMCERCVQLLDELPTIAGEAGVPWDSAWLKTQLAYLVVLIRARKRSSPPS